MTTCNNSNLHRAQLLADDEWYTLRADVDQELQHYWRHFKGKRIHCPADGAGSAFTQYFTDNFDALGLKSLHATSYNPNGKGKFVRIDDATMIADMGYLPDDGGLASRSALEIMDRCDIVVTNPPFSTICQFARQVLDMGKDMLIVAPLSAFTYASLRLAIVNRQVIMGVQRVKTFIRPDGTEQSLGNTTWMTTLDHGVRNPPLKLTATYSPDTHPTYDNYDAIECKTCKDIPADYYGKMGVPTTFLERINYDQFEIIGNMRSISDDFTINGKGVFHRLIIKRKEPAND